MKKRMVKWGDLPPKISIGAEEVDIYLAEAGSFKERIPEFSRMLSTEELKRIGNFRFERDREMRTIATALLRTLLSRYIDVDAESVSFSYNDFGKPFIAETMNRYGLEFNLSHSGKLIIFAFSFRRRVGIDVQEKRKIDSYGDIVNRYFSSSEIVEFELLHSELQPDAFYAGWTRKEAYIKAHGRGMSYPLESFTVSLAEGGARLLEDENCDVTGWTLHEIFSNESYTAAVAVEGKGITFRFHKLLNET